MVRQYKDYIGIFADDPEGTRFILTNIWGSITWLVARISLKEILCALMHAVYLMPKLAKKYSSFPFSGRKNQKEENLVEEATATLDGVLGD